jgi:glycosyltransferase involved in cell wall biosynthesis
MTTIALVAPPWYPVPPRGYGGIELVVALLAGRLRAGGHEVALVAPVGSRRAAELAPTSWGGDLGGTAERLRELEYAARVHRWLGCGRGVEVVHDHCGYGTLLMAAAAARAPVLHTVHGPVEEPLRGFYRSLRGIAGLVAISEAQRAAAPELPWVATVHNAVDVDALEQGPPDVRDPFLLCLARICPDKGQHLAIEVARRVGMRLVLAGKVETSPEGCAYFRERVAPHLDGDRVVHILNVAGARKARLLARATALLAPICWDEPFGLCMGEAMCSGTAVIAFRRGAAVELIEDGITGFLVDGPEAMADAVRGASAIDPLRCAARARARFAPQAMADGYVAAYARLLSGGSGARRGAAGNGHRRQRRPGWGPADHLERRPPQGLHGDCAVAVPTLPGLDAHP